MVRVLVHRNGLNEGVMVDEKSSEYYLVRGNTTLMRIEVVREYDFNAYVGNPIVNQTQLGDQHSFRKKRSRQRLHTAECMLYSERKWGKKRKLFR